MTNEAVDDVVGCLILVIELVLLCAVIGAVVGAVYWLLK